MRERKVPQVRTDERPEVATLGEYHMLRRLDSGRTVEVYLAEQGGSRDQPVAVKVVRAVDGSQAALSAEAREAAVGRFLREAHVLSRLAHPNILPVYDAGFENGSLYLAMQYVPDGSLADAIRRRSRYPLRLPAMVPLVIELIDQLASALQYAHDRGIVHGAVRPSNVLVEFGLDAYPHLLLADFGIARELAPAIAGAHAATSAAYMAPEQFGGRALPASDQYALAALAYLLLTKRTPFQGDAAAQTFGHLYGTAPPAHTLKGAVPSEASEVLGRALAKDPRERFPSVTDFAEALREATSESEAALLLGEDALDAHAEAATGTQVTQPDGVPVPGDAPPQGTDASALRGASAESASHRRGRKPIAWIAVAALLMLVLAADVTMNPQQLPQGLGPPAAAAIPSPTATSPPSPTEGLATGDAASITQLAAPAAVLPGQQFTVHITFANTGATTWTDGAGYRLVCDAVRHPQQNCPSRMDVTLAGMTIAPGRTTRFTLTLVAPREPGTYQTWVNLSRNGTLFPTPDAHITVTVAPAAPPVAPATPTPRPPTPRPTAVPPTATPRPNPTPTTPPAPSATPAPTTTPTPVPQPTPTTTPAPTPTAAPSPSPTLAPTPTAESTATSSPAPTAEPTSTAAPTRSPSPTAVPTPVLEPTPTPSPFDM